MGNITHLSGVYAAAVTPLKVDLSPDLDGLTNLIHFLANRGCHGVLIMGTTGEGPSFSLKERISVYKSAAKVCESIPNFHLLAGTGTPSLGDTVYLTRSAFDLGFAAVVVLPPYYYRKATDEGLFTWFSQVLKKAVPSERALLGYHIPPVSGVSFSLDLLERLKDAFPDQFVGIKDSSGDPQWARILGERFGKDLLVLNGNDRLFSQSLQSFSSGCITAMANVLSPLHRLVWDRFQTGHPDEITQERLSHAREVLDRHQPMPPLLKQLLSHLHGFPLWKVKPPLQELDPTQVEIILSEFLAAVE
ncbi:MAG: dihydrodipicolinate synthase family protein [Anaerolineales bacterium]